MRVIIVGGGPVGLLVGSVLQKIPTIDDIKLFDSPINRPEMNLALSARSLEIMNHLKLENSSYEPIRFIHVSEKGSFGSIMLSASELGYERFGIVTCSSNLIEEIKKNFNSVEFREITDVKPRSEKTFPAVQLVDGHSIEADLIIICDGGKSSITSNLGIHSTQRPFDRSALLANLRVKNGIQGLAIERFEQDGPLALLPLINDHYGMVWSLSHQNAQSLAKNSDRLEYKVNTCTGGLFGEFKVDKIRGTIPLVEKWVDRPYRPGIVILGNGAQTIHPVAGQGFNLAVRGISHLANKLEKLSSGENPDNAIISFIQDWKEDRSRTRIISSGLENLFKKRSFTRCLMTSTAFFHCDQNIYAKRFFANLGMGLFT